MSFPSRRSPSARCIAWLILAVFAAVCLSPPAFSGPTKLKPYVLFKGEYDDNILYSQTDERADEILTGSAGLVALKTTERLSSRADLMVSQLLYSEHSELNDLGANISASLNYRTTERLTLGGQGRFRSGSLRGKELSDTGIMVLGDRRSKALSLTGSYLTRETGRLDLSLDTDRQTLERSFEDEESRTAGATLKYSEDLSRFWKNTTGQFSLSFLDSQSDTRTFYPGSALIDDISFGYNARIWQTSCGIIRYISPLWQIYLNAGIGYTDTRQTSRTNTVLGSFSTGSDAQNLGGLFLGGATYTGLYWKTNLSLSHDYRAGAGTNGAVKRTTAALNISRRVTDKFRLSLAASGYLNQSDRTTGQDIDQLALRFEPALIYEFDNDFRLQCKYRFTSTEDRSRDKTSERNLVFLELKKTFTFDMD